MENRFKLQISKLLQSTFTSCRPKNTSGVSDHRLFSPENRHHRRLIDLFSPKPPPPQPPSTGKPKPHLPHLKNTPFPANSGGHSSHSVSPIHEKTSKRDRKKKTHHRRRRHNASFSSITDNYYYNWWSSDEDDQFDCKSALFSRRSLSFDSNESVGGIIGERDHGGRTTDVVAVAKDSSDPYEDFKASMVDMIVEQGLFGVEELEKLVDSFVALNSEEHHKVIYEVFAEIWEILIEDLNKRG